MYTPQQTITGISAASFTAHQSVAANNLTVQHAVADCMSGVNAVDVIVITVSAGTTSASNSANTGKSLLSTDSCVLHYK